MYQVGQIVNIGYYDGFHHTERTLNKARITKVHPSVGLVEIRVYLNENGSVGKKMFGLATDLETMEENYRQWKGGVYDIQKVGDGVGSQSRKKMD